MAPDCGFASADLPAWLRSFIRSDLDADGGARATFNVGVVWWSWQVPALLDLTMAATLGLGMLVIAIASLTNAE
jgi:hypothetical protein